MEKNEKDEKIDLSQLTQRELLILTVNKVDELKKDVDSVKKEQHQMALKVNTLETKSKVSGGIAGFLAGIATLFVERLINR